MKKLLSLILLFISLGQSVCAFPTDTTGWACNPDNLSVDASEISLKSDIKNEYKIFQTTLTNLTAQTLDVAIPVNANANVIIEKLLESGLTFKELMAIPKQIAVESYKEDVGEGVIAAAHKGLIYVAASAGAVVVGAGLLGIYPQQKTEEFMSHKKIKKEYKKYNANFINELTLAPLEQKDIYLLLPISGKNACIIHSKHRNDESDIYTDYHQL